MSIQVITAPRTKPVYGNAPSRAFELDGISLGLPRRGIACFACAFLAAASLQGQISPDTPEAAAPAAAAPAVNLEGKRLTLALATEDYPATPGDTYLLTYIIIGLDSTAVSIPLTLDAKRQLKVQNLGIIRGDNKTYIRLKGEVETLVSKNYPLSGASLTLTGMGRFSVLVSGETAVAGNREADGLTRLSELDLQRSLRASARFIEVTSAGGARKVYDLFAAEREGDLSQNPYVRPGDRVVIPAAGKRVKIEGEVYRPGQYELKKDETLSELVDYYSGGFTPEAASDRLILTRRDSRREGSRNTIILDWNSLEAFTLEDGDAVTARNKDIYREAAVFEGAVFAPEGGEDWLPASVPYYFYPGETVGLAARNLAQYFSGKSGLAGAYIQRGAGRLPVNLQRILYQNDNQGDIALAGGDRVVIPFRRGYTLTGEVEMAGDRPLDAMARLSSLLVDLTDRASRRFVRVTLPSGAEVDCDLFKAERFGDMAEDPYIFPGDIVHVLPAGRRVSVAGEVPRPGVYELAPGDDAAVLVDYYAGGLSADPSQAVLRVRRLDPRAGVTEQVTLLYSEASGFALYDNDSVEVEAGPEGLGDSPGDSAPWE